MHRALPDSVISKDNMGFVFLFVAWTNISFCCALSLFLETVCVSPLNYVSKDVSILVKFTGSVVRLAGCIYVADVGVNSRFDALLNNLSKAVGDKKRGVAGRVQHASLTSFTNWIAWNICCCSVLPWVGYPSPLFLHNTRIRSGFR